MNSVIKKIIPLLLIILLLCGCGKEPAPEPTVPETTETVTEPEADETDPTEPPVTMTAVSLVTHTVVTDGDGWGVMFREYVYDAEGRQTELWEFDSENNLTSFSSTTYLSDTEYETLFESGDLRYTVRYTCDARGNILTQETRREGEEPEISAYTYDEYGNMLSMDLSYDEPITYRYTLDDSGRPLVREEYQADALLGVTRMDYDTEGREVASDYCDPEGNLLHSTVTVYEGDTEKRVSCDAEGNAYMTRVTTRDAEGNVLTQETWQGDTLISRVEHEYETFEVPAE